MRVALNVEQLLQRPPGGIGRYTAELARLLPRPGSGDGDGDGVGDGVEVEVEVEVVPFVARHRRSRVRGAMARVGLAEVAPVRLPLPRPALYDAWHLGVPPLKFLAPGLAEVDLVHAPSVAVPPRGAVPLVVTVHDAAVYVFPEAYPRRGRRFHERGTEDAARRADLVITVSRAAADEIVLHTSITEDRIRVVPLGVTPGVVTDGEVAETRDALGIGSPPYVLWVGTLEPRKNLPLLVEAFGAVVRAGDLPHRLVVVGSAGWLDAAGAVRAVADALGDRIVFTGAVTSDRLAALFRGADMFAFPSLHEGFGLPVLEAMAQETAVLCSDIPVLREVAADAARYVPATDVGAWGDGLVEMLRDEGARSQLARAGHSRAAGFTWERCIERTRAVYREAIGS